MKSLSKFYIVNFLLIQKESSDRKLDTIYMNMEREFDMRAKLLSPNESSKLFPLHEVAYRGELGKAKLYVEEKQHNPLQMDSYGNTAVHYAAAGGSLLMLKYFVEERQCSAACLSITGRTPLHYAAEHKHLELVKYLVAGQQMDPMIQDKQGVTVLHSACVGGDIQIIHYLIKELTKYSPLHDVVNDRVKVGNAPIHFAALYGHLNLVKLFIAEFKCDPNILGWWDRTPLHASAQEGHLDVVKYLVDEEMCDVLCSDRDGVTPLHLAAAKGQLDTVKFLADRSGHTLVANVVNDTPLHWAAEFGQLDVIKFFVQALNCSTELKGHLNMTPLEIAGRNGHIHVTQYLCQLCQELEL